MAIYKRGGKYWFSFVFGGHRIQRSTKQGNRQAAIDIESAHRTALAKGDVGLGERKPIPTFEEFAVRFTAHVKIVHAAKPATMKHYLSGMRRLLEYPDLRKARLNEINSELVSKYSAWRESQPLMTRAKKRKLSGKLPKVRTINYQLETLRRLLHVAVEWSVIPAAPRIKRLQGEGRRDRVVSHEEERAYLDAATPLLRMLASILVDTGMRPEELHRLRWENVHLQPSQGAHFGRIFITAGKTDAARRNVPLTQRANNFLQVHGPQKEGFVFPAPATKSKHIEDCTIRRSHANALKKSGVKPFVLYSLRHTALTRLGEAGADSFSIKKIAGHESILISQRYVHPSPERIENAFDSLEKYNAQKNTQVEIQARGLVQ